MSKIGFVDCQGLAGAWTLGAVQAGMELVTRKSLPGGFGNDCIDANRDLIGWDWNQETGLEDTWAPAHGVGFLCGTPPCSGFSLLNTSKNKNARGSDSEINNCMKDLTLYASRCFGLDGGEGPEIVSFESVQQAYSTGRNLMVALRDGLNDRTGQNYEITHVKMSGSAIGAAQMRHRYFPVFHRIPFQVETPEKKHVVTYEDAIGDLIGADIQWTRQAYPSNARIASYAWKLRRDDNVLLDHITVAPRTLTHLINELLPYWMPGESLQKAAMRFYDKHGTKPAMVKEKAWMVGVLDDEDVRKLGPLKGWSWPTRVSPVRPGYVLTGAGLVEYVHWSEPRLFTVREGSRLMGYPDDWDWSFVKSPMAAGMLIGKCCPVGSGKWISEWIRHAIDSHYDDGAQPLTRGDVTELSPGEWIHDSTNVYKPWLAEQQAARE